jgi:superfamily II DNA/RNA helicase
MSHFSSFSLFKTPERSESRAANSDGIYDPTTQPYCNLQALLKSKFTAIPEDFVEAYSSQAPPLHFWQFDVIQRLSGCSQLNIALSAPTSSGKTLIAEVAILNKLYTSSSSTISGKPKKVLYIAPYKEIIDQKYDRFSSVLNLDGGRGIPPFSVCKLKGRDCFSTRDNLTCTAIEINPIKIFQSVDVAVSTYEMAAIVIDKMIKDGSITNLGLVVIDEIHFVSELGRGNKLESTLTQLVMVNRFLHLEGSEQIQLLAMSGSMKNPGQMASWLGGHPYVTEYRPIPVNRFIVTANGDVLSYNEKYKELNLVSDKKLKPSKILGDFGFLAIQLILKKLSGGGGGALVFVSTQKEAVNLAKRVVGLTTSEHKKMALLRNKEPCRWNSMECMGHGLNIDSLENKELVATIKSWGIAFHHGSLSDKDRQFVVQAYNKGCIKCIIATTTLAVGANLAAEMVIVHGLEHGGPGDMSPVLYGQMEGRGGRPGLSNSADIYVINKKDKLHPRLISERYFETKGLVDLESRLLPVNIGEVYKRKKVVEKAKANRRGIKRKLNDVQARQHVDHLRDATIDFQRSLLQSLSSPLFLFADKDGMRCPISYQDVAIIFESTLAYHLQPPVESSSETEPNVIKKVGFRALRYLLALGLVIWDNNNKTCSLTEVGVALGLSGLPVHPALEFIRATKNVFSRVEVHKNQTYGMYIIYTCLTLFSNSTDDIRKVFDIEENFWRNWLEYYNNMDPLFQDSADFCGISSTGYQNELYLGAHAQPNAYLQQLCRNANVRNGDNVREKHKTFLAAIALYKIIIGKKKPMQVYKEFCKSQRFNKKCVSELAFKNCLKEFKQILEQVGRAMSYLEMSGNSHDEKNPAPTYYGEVSRRIYSLRRGLCEVMSGWSR